MRSLTKHLQANNVLDGCQHGFQHGRSTITNLLECDASIAEYVNDNTACDVIAFDFSRAFDKVDHSILCNKLKSAGVDGCYLRWIIDYLSNRKQFITHKEAHSALYDVPSGVIQGSASGPELFTIFINDLCKVIKYAKPSFFADDLKIVGDVSTPDNCESMQADVNAIAAWSVANKLPISLDKSATLHYGKNNLKWQYVIHQQTMKTESDIMDLGVQCYFRYENENVNENDSFSFTKT